MPAVKECRPSNAWLRMDRRPIDDDCRRHGFQSAHRLRPAAQQGSRWSGATAASGNARYKVTGVVETTPISTSTHTSDCALRPMRKAECSACREMAMQRSTRKNLLRFDLIEDYAGARRWSCAFITALRTALRVGNPLAHDLSSHSPHRTLHSGAGGRLRNEVPALPRTWRTPLGLSRH